MSYYSLVVFATISKQYDPIEHRETTEAIYIEPGINVFTILTDEVESLVSKLKADGHRIDEVNILDGTSAHHGLDSETGRPTILEA